MSDLMDIAQQAPLSSTISWSLLRFMSIDLVMLSNHLILRYLLFLWPSIFPSNRVFSGESALHIRWPNHWIFSFSMSPFFRIDWFDLLAVQGTLKSLLQHNLKASILQHSAFLMVQLSHPYMTTGKAIALTIRSLSARWCLCFLKTLSRLVIGEGNGTPLQYSCLENPMDGGAW